MTELPKEVQKLLNELYKVQNLSNKKKVDELMRTLHASMVPAVQGGVMNVESMIASKSKSPIVIFTWNENRGELTPVQARQYALQIMESAEAAVQDATIYEVLTRDGGDEKNAIGLVRMIRENRRKFEGGEQ